MLYMCLRFEIYDYNKICKLLESRFLRNITGCIPYSLITVVLNLSKSFGTTSNT